MENQVLTKEKLTCALSLSLSLSVISKYKIKTTFLDTYDLCYMLTLE